MYKTKFQRAALSALFTAVIAICGMITVPAPIPVTLQTLGVFTATLFLGGKNGFLSVFAYILLGAVGLPVFAGFGGGIGVLFGPTGGYIWGFLFIPLVFGLLSNFSSKKHQALYCFAGLVLCYLLGSVWYAVYVEETAFHMVLIMGVLPFILPDVAKLYLASKITLILTDSTDRMFSVEGKLNRHSIRKKLSTEVSVFTYEEIDSTNTEAVRKIRDGIKLPALFVAERQTEGRGRRGRSFYSSGGGLYLTLAVSGYKNFDAVSITTRAAVAVSKAIEELTKNNIGIKWVNDIYLQSKKICGILCEAVRNPENGKSEAFIVGVGINLNVKDFPEELKEIAGSLEARDLTHELLAAKITENLLDYLSEGKEYIEEYKKRSIVLGEEVRYTKNGCEYTGRASDIDENGALIVQTEQGTQRLDSGEITLRVL